MPELVFDIGMFDGEDTAYYLERGFDVVGVDANPVLCAAAERRFASEIATGRLSVLNVGLTEEHGDLEFWISDHLDWSSFDHVWATRQGVHASVVRVPTMRFSELLGKFPPARHVKIDIEGRDSYCLHDLVEAPALPKSLSFEAHPLASADIALLAGLGFARFKCVRQNDFVEVTPRNVARSVFWRKAIARLKRARLNGPLERAHYRIRPVADRAFRQGTSGPLPWELAGPWLSQAEVTAVWEQLLTADEARGGGDLCEWFDLHAAREW